MCGFLASFTIFTGNGQYDGVDRQRRMRWDACRRTCLDKMATYDSILWDDVMIEELMGRKFAWLTRQYHEYDYEVQRSDVAR